MDFLKKKWSYWFTTLDVNHDGVITREDVDSTLRDFPKVEGLSEAEAKLAIKRIEKWWNMYILKGRKKISEPEFLKDLEKQYTHDKETFKSTYRACFYDITSVIDTDHTKSISLDNYVKAFKVWGHSNEMLLWKSFDLYKPDHGMIPIKEYSDDWANFITNDDPTKPDVVMETYKAGLV
jgi:Ca2+-binding EF-hand superfamily protein